MTSLDFQTIFAIMMEAIGLDFSVNPKEIVYQENGLFVMVTIIVGMIQKKIQKSVTVVSEA